jgi:hypothetical protein
VVSCFNLLTDVTSYYPLFFTDDVTDKAGDYMIEIHVNGFAVESSGKISAGLYVPSKAGTRTVRILVFFFGLILFAGNTKGNGKIVFGVSAVLVPIALGVLYIDEVKIQADIMSSTFKEVSMATILALIIACFVYEMLREVIGFGGRYFADERRSGYLMYVHRMFHGEAISPIYEKRVKSQVDDGTVRVFRQKSTLSDAFGSHTCSLEANLRVTSGITLGC